MNYKLTSSQKNIWNLQKYYGGTAISNICGAIFFDIRIQSDWIQRALNLFLSEQDGFRLRFYMMDGEIHQTVFAYEKEEFVVKEFSSREEYQAYIENEKMVPFQMENGKMYRFTICQFRESTAVFTVLNHLVSDAWTLGVLASRLSQILSEMRDGNDVHGEKYSYISHVEEEEKYFQSKRFQKDEAYWKEVFSEHPETAYMKPERGANAKATAGRLSKFIEWELSDRIRSFCGEHGITPVILFETAMFLYLGKINMGKPNITIGSLVLNRIGNREKRTAGMFVSTIPLMICYSEKMTVSELLHHVKERQGECLRHQRYPYAKIREYVREKFQVQGNLYDVMVSYQNARIESEIPFCTEWYGNGFSEVALALHIDDRDGNGIFHLTMDYQTDVFPKQQEMVFFYHRMLFVLWQLLADENRTVAELSILPETERQKLIVAFNDTYVEYPREKCVHELFTEQAEKTPDKIALVFEDQEFTYRQLDEMSNSLAHFLRKKGVKPNDIVPIIAKRSFHIIVAMLAVMKAGGAFLSVDVNYPYERIKHMFDNANVKLLLKYKDKLADFGYPAYELETFDYKCDCTQLVNVNSSDDMCYLIYTSGSTGEPKGLCIAHFNVSNFSCRNEFNVNGKIVCGSHHRFLSTANTIFDMFMTGLFIPLTSGGTMILANEEETVSAGALNILCNKAKPHIIETTPTKLKMLLAEGKFSYLDKFEKIILGGEALETSLLIELSCIITGKIYNNYGPAETTVWSTISYVSNEDITIGKPIANTQIYILDKNQNPAPIGVAGELCIAGDGVGLGYLNRPDLTEEKFVPNPFATEENCHGKTMYKTGDLARWRTDGEIEYLGRIDTQVKIRGLRIELGEIESVMSGFNGIKLTAVSDKKDEKHRQYLVGYYTAENEIDEKELRSYLSSKLPQYMIPNYFVKLDVMPITSSGKTDRKNLPLPNFAFEEREYTAPETEQEKMLCRLMETLLHIERVGAEDNFFECGGDSLTAIEYVAKAHSEGVEFSLQNVFDYPEVRSLCSFLSHGGKEEVNYKASDFEKYNDILGRNVADESVVFEKKSLGNVLLTGATGFLGAHVLDRLMQEESGRIYCLVRSNGTDDRRGRLREILNYYFGDKYDNEFGRRIIPIIGDIEKEEVSEEMPTDIQTVIHTAASVKHYGSYSYFHKVNTEGTGHMVAYAKAAGARLVHISTLSVSGNSLADDFNVYRSEEEKFFHETSFYIGQPLDNVYIRSKFEAERRVYDAALDGLDAVVIRVGNLTNRVSDYKFQPNFRENAFLTRVKAILEFGLFPDYLMNLYAEFSPIDKTAEGVVKIAQYPAGQTVFHLNSNRVIYFDRFLETLHGLGIPMEVVGGSTFNQALQRTMKDGGTEYIFEAFQNDMDGQGHLMYESNIHIKNDFTLWFLRKAGFEWNETDAEYIRGYIEYFRKIGYLKV